MQPQTDNPDRHLTEAVDVTRLPPAVLPPAVERLLDTEYLAECEVGAPPEVTLAEVRAGLASIPGDMTADFASEGDDR